MNKFRFYALFLLLNFTIYVMPLNAQTNNEIISPLSIINLGGSSLGSGGVTGMELGESSAPINNPAAIYAKTFSVYSEFEIRKETEYFFSDMKYDGQFLLPAYASLVVPYDDFMFAFGFANIYNQQITTENIEVTTVENPNGTGEYYDMLQKRNIDFYFASVSFKPVNWFSVGLTAGYQKLWLDDRFYKTTLTGKGNAYAYIGGILFSPLNNLNIGASLQYFEHSTLSMYTNSRFQTLDTISGNIPITTSSLALPNYKFSYPMQSRLGFSYKAFPTLTILASIEMYQWAKNRSSFNNTIQKHFGLQYSPTDLFAIRLGFYTQQYPSKEIRGFDQQFVTAGIDFTINEMASISLGGATSKFFKNPEDKTTTYIPIKNFHQQFLKSGIEIRW